MFGVQLPSAIVGRQCAATYVGQAHKKYDFVQSKAHLSGVLFLHELLKRVTLLSADKKLSDS